MSERNLCTNFTETFDCADDKNSDSRKVTTTFDLTDLDDNDILELARRSMVISMQSKIRTWRKGNREKAFDETSYKVPKPGTRTGADPLKKATDMLAKLTPEQRAALIASLS